MKNKLILAVIVIMLITSAFTAKSNRPGISKKQASFYWFIPGTTPTYSGRQNTHADEIIYCGCSDTGSLHCEDGYDDDDLVTSGNPYDGLKSGATINDFIRKSY